MTKKPALLKLDHPKKSADWARMTAGGSTKQNREDRIRVLDGFHTPPVATEALLENVIVGRNVWEPTNGFSALSNVLAEHGRTVARTDIFKWCKDTTSIVDFTDTEWTPFKGKKFDIVTNPPFSAGKEFVEAGMRLLPVGGKLCLLLRLQFLEGQKRQSMFRKSPPSELLVFSKRLPRMHRFDFDPNKFVDEQEALGKKRRNLTSTLCFAWFVFEKKANEKQQRAVQTSLKWI